MRSSLYLKTYGFQTFPIRSRGKPRGNRCANIFFNYRVDVWGWATWADRWACIDWEVKGYTRFIMNPFNIIAYNRSSHYSAISLRKYFKKEQQLWNCPWTWHLFKNDLVAVFPRYSHVNNIGNDGTGENFEATSIYNNDLSQSEPVTEFHSETKIRGGILDAIRKSHGDSIGYRMKQIFYVYFGEKKLNQFANHIKKLLMFSS